MEFAAFADRAAAIEAESADLEIVDLVTDLFREADEDLAVVARLIQGRVFPAHVSTKLDVGPALCYEAIARAAEPGVDADDVEERLAEHGDVGAVAASYDLGGQQGLAAFGDGGQDGLTVTELASELDALAAASGSGSQETKLDVLFGLFSRCSPEEARYLARIVLSEMRIGVGEGTVRDAIANAFDVPVGSVGRALQVSNDYGYVAEVARDAGAGGLDAMDLTIGRPIKAMLAQAGTVTDALEDWEEAAVEWKFDGARVQVHVAEDRDSIHLFSRNMEDVTDPLPEIVEAVRAGVDGPAIVDGEVVAIDEDSHPLPFQEILRRFRRKHDVEQVREDVAVEFRAFDCLHVDGEDLLDAPFTERHDRLQSIVDDVPDLFVAALTLTDDPEEIASIEAEALAAGHEGVMLKEPDAAYTPGRRGKHWLKIKPDVETLDLVVTGAEWGEGRRANFLGTFHLSVVTDDGFARIGNVATGVTDEQLAELTELLEPPIEAQDGQHVDLEPAVVFEVGYEEIQTSPTYDSGYALRFPRFVAVREDKDPEGADTLERVARLASRV